MNLELAKVQKEDIDFLYDLRMQTMSEHLKKAGVNLTKDEHLSRIDHHFDKSFLVRKDNQKVGMLKLAEEEDHFRNYTIANTAGISRRRNRQATY